MNPIIFYVLHEFAQDFFPHVFSQVVDRRISRFLFSLTGALFWLWVATIFFRQKIFIRI